jgi:hypothetical protein
MNNLDEQIAEILNAVFEHGKQTPDKSYDLPKGQTTIAEAIDDLKALILKTCEEVIGGDEDEAWLENQGLYNMNEDLTWNTTNNPRMTRNMLRAQQRQTLKELITE